MDDLVKRLEAAEIYTVDGHSGIPSPSTLGDQAAATIRSLRAQVAAYEKGLLELIARGVDKSDYPKSLWSLMLALCERQ